MSEGRGVWRLASSQVAATPVAIIEIHVPPDPTAGVTPAPTLDLSGVLERLGLPCAIGKVRHGTLASGGERVESCVVARPDASNALLTVHGGRAIITRVARVLARVGLEQNPRPFEAATPDLERAMAIARSPLAIDLLLTAGRGGPSDPARDSRLNRLIHPPRVVLLGPPNVGKSTLLNTLAGADAAITHDAPGTTRDRVGAEVNVGGLVCSISDLPGVRETVDPVEREAIALAIEHARGADLVVLCGDVTSPDPKSLEIVEDGLGDEAGRCRVWLRADLGTPSWAGEGDLGVSATTGVGVDELVRRVREALVPEADLRSSRRWDFSAALA